MKMKRLLSVLLALALLLAVLPGMALAEEEESAPASAPLYWKYPGSSESTNPITNNTITQPVGGGTRLLFYTDQEGQVSFPTDAVFMTGPNLGDVFWIQDNCWMWDSNSAVPGTSGAISVLMNNTIYSVPVQIRSDIPAVGFYSTDTANINNYIPMPDGRVSFSYTNTARSVYLITNGQTIDSAPANMEPVSFVLSTDKTMLTISVPNDFNGTCNRPLTVSIGGNTRHFNISFVPALPSGYSQMYVKSPDGYITELSQPVNGVNAFKMEIDRNGASYTDGSYTYTCSSGLGTVNWNSSDDRVVWNTANASAGEGWIFAEKGESKYAIRVSVSNAADGPNDGPQTPTLPDGYGQMYAKGAHDNRMFSNIGQPAGGGDFGFVPTTDAAGTNTLNLNQYTFTLAKENAEGPSIGSVNVNEGKVCWSSKTAYPGFRGWILAEPNVNAGTDTKYAIHVSVNKPMFGVYSSDRTDLNSPVNGYFPRSEDGTYVISYNPNEQTGRTVYIVPGEGKSIPTDASISFEDGNANITAARTTNGNIAVTLNANFSGSVGCLINVPYVEDGEPYTKTMAIEFTDGNQGGGNQDGPGGFDPSKLTQIDAGGIIGPTDQDKVYIGTCDWADVLAPFELDNTTYYMAVCMENDNYPNHNNSVGNTLLPGQTSFPCMEIGFFVHLGGNNYNRVVDEDLLAKIYAAVTNFNISVLSYQNAGQGFSCSAADRIPATFRDPNRTDSHIYMQMGQEHDGVYVIVGEGTIGETTLRSEITFEWDPRTEIIFEYDEAGAGDFIAQLNDFLQALPNITEYQPVLLDRKAVITVNLPQGDLSGYILVPHFLDWNHVDIYGVRNSTENLTNLRGGIINDNGATHIYGVNFIGAGGNGNGNDQKWKGGPNDGLSNIALSGDGMSVAKDCVFQGYDIAIHSTVGWKTSRYSQFFNNNTAICIDTPTATGGNSDMCGNMFKGNGIGLHFNRLSDDMAVTWINLKENCFIDNKTDIRNDLERNVFMPGCYFAVTDEGGNEIYRECRYLPVANGSLEKQVLYYPQATTPACDEYNFDTSDYAFDPVVSVYFTATFPIPAGALDGATFYTKDKETYLARISFQPQTRMMFRMTRNAVNSFDATVVVERSEDGRTITVTTQPFPNGKTATISVPCDENWKQAEVTALDSSKLEATVADGYVSFTVSAGGTFVITETSSAGDEEPGTPTPAPVVPTTPPAETPSVDTSAPVVDSTVTENADGSSTKTETLENGVVVETTTNTDGSTVTAATKTEETEQGTVATTETAMSNGSKGTTTVDETGKVEAEVTVSAAAKSAAAAADAPVALPMPAVEASADSETAATVKVDLPAGTASATVAIPVAEGTGAGTVAVIVNADGSETVITDSIVTENGLEVEVPDGATIKVVDNSTEFKDVPDSSWAKNAVDFASARSIMQGTSTGENATFAPNNATTRAMVWTMLARLSGADTAPGEGQTWYDKGQEWAMANGISDGTNANGEITREQLASMLHRYVGKPESNQDLSKFNDHEKTSDWAQTAKQWAVEMGVIGGKGNADGSLSLDPTGDASRAEVAQMLMNFIKAMSKKG